MQKKIYVVGMDDDAAAGKVDAAVKAKTIKTRTKEQKFVDMTKFLYLCR